MRGTFFIVFMIIMSCLAVISTVLWQYICRLHKRVRTAIIILAITLVALLALTGYGVDFRQLAGTKLFEPTYYASMFSLSWLFMFFLAFPVVVIVAVFTFIWRWWGRGTAGHSEGKNISRRTFLKGIAAAVPLLTLGTSTYGIFDGESSLKTTYHKLSFPDLPAYLDGYRIAQISDTHMGLFFSPERLKEALDAAIAAKADHLVITGDLCDELSLLPQCQQLLNEAAPHFPAGMDFIYGNHEYYRGIVDITAMLEETPVRILRNSNYLVANGSRPFYMAGVDYSFAKGDEAFKEQRETFTQEALDGIPDNAFVVLLAHHSAFLDEGFAHNVALTLAGHTHGGQFAPIGWLVQTIGFKYLRGLFTKGNTYGYVNRGTGHWLPLRIGCSREVSVFELGVKN